MFQFANPIYLYGLAIIPVLVLLVILTFRYRKQQLKQFGNLKTISVLMPDISKSRPTLKFIFLTIGLIFIILGLAGPQFGSKLQEVKRKGVELVIALDVSNSMLAEDIKPSRLERSKRAISKMIDKLENDKIGLIVFAGDAYTQLPMTSDFAAAKMFLESVSPSIVPKQGTAIGTAIDLAMKSFTQESDRNRAIVIITDGENHEDDAVEMAGSANEKGIIVHTIGMGLPQGAPIPINGKYGQKDFRTDKDGNVVITKLNQVMLQQIAASGGGKYIPANNTNTGLNKLFDEINKMEKKRN
jgi:Ca-activated chloride channel homolog